VIFVSFILIAFYFFLRSDNDELLRLFSCVYCLRIGE
jgi:hypothetical protein